MSDFFSGLLYEDQEERDLLSAQCIDFDIMSLVCGDVPETRGLKELMRRDDQYNVNSCSGFGLCHAFQVALFNQTGVWRFFNPMWIYRRGQEKSNIRGDRGATINGVVKAAKQDGVLPEDFDGDGVIETKYQANYNMSFPRDSARVAKQWKVGYSIELETFDEILRFLQTGQGAVIIGGDWGNWKPDGRGVANRFRGGGGGHARAYIDWITIDGEVMLVEANSHGDGYGDGGFAYHTKNFVNEQARAQWTVTTGLSDLQTPMVRQVLTYDDLLKRVFAKRGVV